MQRVKKKKDEEKPSFLSKRVVRTQIRNEWENIKLEETYRQMNRDRYNMTYNFIQNTQNLNNRLLEIHKVKTRLSVSPERRIFARKHGFEIKAKDFEMNHLMRLLFNKGTLSNITTTPLIRVQDLKLAKEKEEMELELARQQDTKEASSQQEIIIETTHHGTIQKLRKIEPPKKGREMWKFHSEKRRIERDGEMSKDQESGLEEAVNAYRKRIVYKIEQVKRPSTAQPFSYKQRQGSTYSNKRRQKSAGPITRCQGSINKQEQLESEITKQLPDLSINEISKDERTSKTPVSLDKRRQRPISWRPDEFLNKNPRQSCYARSKRPNNSYCEMRLHIQGQTKSLFVSKF